MGLSTHLTCAPPPSPGNFRVRSITTGGLVTTVAGTGGFGSANGAGTSSTFGNSVTNFAPTGVAAGPGGLIYIADQSNNRVRVLNTTSGLVSTLAGGINSIADGPVSVALFNYLFTVAVGLPSDGSPIFVNDRCVAELLAKQWA